MEQIRIEEIKKIPNYNLNERGCLGCVCPYGGDCLVGIAEPPVKCQTNVEVEETARQITHSIMEKLFDDYGINCECDDYKAVFYMMKNYVIDERLKPDDILEIQCETLGTIAF